MDEDKTIDELILLTAPDENDMIPIWDKSVGMTKKVPVRYIVGSDIQMSDEDFNDIFGG